MKTLYRILSPIFCIAAIPIAIFMPAIRLVITSSLSANIMSTFGIKEYTSIFDLIKMISTADENSSQLFKVIYQIFTAEDSKIADMLTTTPWLIAAAVLLAAALVVRHAVAVGVDQVGASRAVIHQRLPLARVIAVVPLQPQRLVDGDVQLLGCHG